MGEYGRENAKHLFAYLMIKGACQLDILDKPSWGRELTSGWGCVLNCETLPIFIPYPLFQLHLEEEKVVHTSVTSNRMYCIVPILHGMYIQKYVHYLCVIWTLGRIFISDQMYLV